MKKRRGPGGQNRNTGKIKVDPALTGLARHREYNRLWRTANPNYQAQYWKKTLAERAYRRSKMFPDVPWVYAPRKSA